MTRFGSLLILFVVGCAASVEEPPAVEPPKQGLQLHAELVGPKVLLAGKWPALKAALVNASVSDVYRVVKPGDGSEMGWREPHVYWTGVLDRGDGKPVPLPKPDLGRCGLFDADWDKDTIQLEPGGELALGWFDPRLELQSPGKVRLQAHYEYHAGRGPLSRSRWTPPYPHQMQGVEPFVLASEPVELEIERPLDVEVIVKKPLKAGVKTRVSAVLDVRMTNRTNQAIRCESNQSYASVSLHLFVRRPLIDRLETTTDSEDPNVPTVIGPGEAVSLVRPSLWAGGFDGTWMVEHTESVKVRAMCFVRMNNDEGCEILSEWVVIPVEK